jgi:hypothetical protein
LLTTRTYDHLLGTFSTRFVSNPRSGSSGELAGRHHAAGEDDSVLNEARRAVRDDALPERRT